MDSLKSHFEDTDAMLKRVNDQLPLLQSVATGWYAFDKYYSIIDQTGAYTAALLLNPNCRKSYITLAWPRA